MYRIRPEKPVEISRDDTLDRARAPGDSFEQPAFGIFRQEQAMNASGGIFQRCFDSVKTEQANRPVAVGATLTRVAGERQPRLQTARRSAWVTGKAGRLLLPVSSLFKVFF
jgi:hypothetical protein